MQQFDSKSSSFIDDTLHNVRNKDGMKDEGSVKCIDIVKEMKKDRNKRYYQMVN